MEESGHEEVLGWHLLVSLSTFCWTDMYWSQVPSHTTQKDGAEEKPSPVSLGIHSLGI